jgi:hypothetical protein
LETILPPLVNQHVASGASDNDLILAIKPVITVFVDALMHIPKHRRLHLFTILVTTLGVEHFLFVVIGLLLAKYNVADRSNAAKKSDDDNVTDFCVSLAGQFAISGQVGSLVALVQSVSKLMQMDSQDLWLAPSNQFVFCT